MKKFAVFIIVALVLSVSVFAAHEYLTTWEFPRTYGGVQRVTNYDPRVNIAKVSATVPLSPPGPVDYKGVGRGGYNPAYPRGTARLQSNTNYGFPRAAVTINTKDLLPSYDVNTVYEAWLVDADTGYRLSLGTFTTGFGGSAEFTYNSDIYLDPYDWVEITAEPFDDMDVLPGPIALLGTIPAPNHFDPAAKSAKMISDSVRMY